MNLLEGSVGVEDLVLLEPLEQEPLLKNLQLRYESKEIYVSASGCPWLGVRGQRVHGLLWLPPPPNTAYPPTPAHSLYLFLALDLHWECVDLSESLPTAAHLWPGVHCQIPGLYLL